MAIVQGLALALVAALSLASAYHVALVVVGLAGRRRRQPGGSEAAHTFAIVIPAHDEEQTLGRTLESCAELDYPREKYDVFVVADNCTDATARVAVASGVTCLERWDMSRRGKGQAIEWALERILPRGHDAVVVLDADCRIDYHALRAFDRCLSEGDRVAQANYVASNPDESATSYAAAVANAIENDLFYAPKSRLGMSVFLRGTGMVFHREVLEQHPWRAGSIAEDAEYTLDLLRAGIRVRYVADVCVRSDFPSGRSQLGIQRRRWVGGGIALAKAHAASLIWEGLVRRRGLLIDGGWTLMILPRSLFLLALVAAVALGSLGAWLRPSPRSDLLLGAALVLTTAQLTYFAVGVSLLGLTRRRVSLLMGTPAAAIKMLGIALAGVFGTGGGPWLKTPRSRA